MTSLKNPEIWIENVGEIMLSEDEEFFWMLPEIFVSTYSSCVASPYFSFDQENWRLVIMPSNGTCSTLITNGWFGVFLWIKGCNILKQRYGVRLSVIESDGKEIYYHSGELDSYYGFGKWNFLPLITYNLTLSGRIKICCVIQRKEDNPSNLHLCSASENEENENGTVNMNDKKEKNASESKGVDRLVENFKKLLNDEVSSDVILKTKDHEFHAHSIILGARSPVFSPMFQHDMEEKKTGEVDITDCSTAGFKVFLEYLYTGSADSMSPANVLDLYYIADKYQVDDLKSICVDYMKSSLAIYNICDVITLSLKHNDSDLQSFATRFFSRNIKKIIKTVQWQNYITENPIQANELFIKAINA